MNLRPYQQSVSNEIARFLAGPKSSKLVVMATGTGKTRVFVDAAKRAGKTVVLVHRDELIKQAINELRKEAPGLKVGREQAGYRAEPDADVVVASIPSVGRANSSRLDWFDPNLIVVDEAHHAGAESYRMAIARLSKGEPKHVLGFTATPHREKGTALFGEPDSAFESVIYNYELRRGMQEGFLSPLRGYLVRTSIDVSRVRILASDFNEGELTKAIDTDTRNAIALKAWTDHAKGRKTIIFCAGVDHARHVAELFSEHGIGAVCVSGTYGAERDDILDRYRNGDIEVLTNAMLLTEGYDAPATSCIVMLRPTKSWTAYVQMIGRGTRNAEGKKDCIVLDVVDVTGKHDVCTLPKVAGLPGKTDMAGTTLEEAFKVSDQTGEIEDGLPFEGHLGQVAAWVENRKLVAVDMANQGDSKTKRIPKLYTAWGETKTLYCWEQDPRCSVRGPSILKRLKKGWSMEDAISVPAPSPKEFVGQTFGYMTVLAKDDSGKGLWLCRCVCGKKVFRPGNKLASGVNSSCGCKMEEFRRESRISNGVSKLYKYQSEMLTVAEIARRIGRAKTNIYNRVRRNPNYYAHR